MVRQTLKIFQYILEDFRSVSGHFGMLCINTIITAGDFLQLTLTKMLLSDVTLEMDYVWNHQ